MAVDRLPVVDDVARILADEVRLDLLDGHGAGSRATLGDRLAKTGDALVGVHPQEEPARTDEEGLELGDADLSAESLEEALADPVLIVAGAALLSVRGVFLALAGLLRERASGCRRAERAESE